MYKAPVIAAYPFRPYITIAYYTQNPIDIVHPCFLPSLNWPKLSQAPAGRPLAPPHPGLGKTPVPPCMPLDAMLHVGWA